MDSKTKEVSKVEDITDKEEEKKLPTFLDRVHDLVLALMKVDGYRKHSGMVNFRKRLEETMVELDPSEPSNQKLIERNLGREEIFQSVFEKFYNDGRSSLRKGNLSFLLGSEYKITVGKNGNTHLPIGEIYTNLEKEASDSIVTIEACVFLLSQFVCPDEDLDTISEICEEFVESPTAAPGNFFDMIGEVVDKASAKFTKYGKELEGPDGKMNRGIIAEIAQDIMDDDEITRPFQQMITSIGGDDFDISEVKEQILGKKK